MSNASMSEIHMISLIRGLRGVVCSLGEYTDMLLHDMIQQDSCDGQWHRRVQSMRMRRTCSAVL